jgi:hypothetical protein
MADLTDIQRAVLRMLAKSTRGYALSTVMARGFTFEMLQDLVRAECPTRMLSRASGVVHGNEKAPPEEAGLK